MPVYVGGRPADLDAFDAICKKHGLYLIGDGAQAVGSEYKGKNIGCYGIATSISCQNSKNLTCGEGGNGTEKGFFSAQGVIIEAVKNAEDGNGLILRAYEPYGTHAKMRIALNEGVKITPCDLMEKPIGEAFTADAIRGEAKPFEILTWRIEK